MSLSISRQDVTSTVARRLIAALNAELSAGYPEPGATHFRLETGEVAAGRGAFLVAPRIFRTARPWDDTRQRDGSTVEYRVDHRRWRTRAVRDAMLEGDLTLLFGKYLACALDRAPDSAWLADASRITVHAPLRVPS